MWYAKLSGVKGGREREVRKGVRSGQAKSPQFLRFCHLSSVEFAEFRLH